MLASSSQPSTAPQAPAPFHTRWLDHWKPTRSTTSPPFPGRPDTLPLQTTGQHCSSAFQFVSCAWCPCDPLRGVEWWCKDRPARNLGVGRWTRDIAAPPTLHRAGRDVTIGQRFLPKSPGYFQLNFFETIAEARPSAGVSDSHGGWTRCSTLLSGLEDSYPAHPLPLGGLREGPRRHAFFHFFFWGGGGDSFLGGAQSCGCSAISTPSPPCLGVPASPCPRFQANRFWWALDASRFPHSRRSDLTFAFPSFFSGRMAKRIWAPAAHAATALLAAVLAVSANPVTSQSPTLP